MYWSCADTFVALKANEFLSGENSIGDSSREKENVFDEFLQTHLIPAKQIAPAKMFSHSKSL